MGLSAAQARLLTITARKSDCEFLSMSLSHEKIALARDMEKVSSDYQSSLNQTTLVYDYYGSNTSKMNLTYGLLMSPSVYNDYFPKLVTDQKNKVVLNPSYAAAARAAGIPQEGLSGTPSSDVRNAFLESMAAENIITPIKAATIEGVTYGNTLGIGDTVSENASISEITYDDLLTLISANCSDSASWSSSSGQALTFGTSENFVTYGDGGTNYEFIRRGTSGEIINGTNTSINIEDLLSTDPDHQYTVYFQSNKATMTPITETAYLQQQIIGESENSPSFLNWLTEQFSTVLGGVNSNNLALQYAYNAVYDLIYPNSNIQQSAEKFSTISKDDRDDDTQAKNRPNSSLPTYGEQMAEVGSWTGSIDHKNGNRFRDDVVAPAVNYIGFTYSAGNKRSDNDGNDHSAVALDLNNITQVFLTAFVEYQKGLDNSFYNYNVGNLKDSNLYDPNDDDFKFVIPVDSTNDNSDANLEASFYDTLFNVICLQGWVENDQIEDSQYMQEMFKSGNLFISSISDDGYYYQGNYSTDSYISDIRDDELIAKAEAKYNTEKTRIQNKEDTLDQKIKSLDTEISALTTEYDTTKSIISKSVEKSFKRYDA